jgi:hypothetical protein
MPQIPEAAITGHAASSDHGKPHQHGNGAVHDLSIWDAGLDTGPIPPRQWLLGNSFCRGFLSSLIAPGGVGKTAVRNTQALALASGRPLSGEHVFHRTRVLVVSLEDDRDELRRRVRAAMLHHGITHDEIRGWLFLCAPGGLGLKLARAFKGEIEPGELGAALTAEIRRYDIGALIIDPFVKAHSVPENDNPAMDLVAGMLARLAADNNCAVDALHHVSKGSSEPGKADRARGASSFKDAARLVYSLSPMSPQEADDLGIKADAARFLVRMDSAKVNLAPPPAKAVWFRLVGVRIGNETEEYPHGDEVQTVESWDVPDLWDGINPFVANQILTAIDRGLPNGRLYSSAAAAGDIAAWRAVVDHLPAKTESQGRQIIKTWIENGSLLTTQYTNPVDRKPRSGLKVNPARRPS